MENRIDELIDFAELDTRLENRELHEVNNLNALLHNIVNDFVKDMEMRWHIFHAEIARTQTAIVLMDTEQLYRVFENILKNAQDYSPEGSTISLRTRLEDNSAVVVISDNGKGIDKQDVELIFKPFHRGYSGRNQGGMGLGLSSAASIIRSHGGTIEYRDRIGGGAQFAITLPLHLS